MNAENEKKLLTDFPKLYSQYHLRECGDGWFDLIYELSKKITELDPKAEATQVKEKFGTLRFCVMSDSDKIIGLISEYEDKSAETCERCGDTETARTRDDDGWLVTLCDKCYERRYKEDDYT
jgi:hypothetical protein